MLSALPAFKKNQLYSTINGKKSFTDCGREFLQRQFGQATGDETTTLKVRLTKFQNL